MSDNFRLTKYGLSNFKSFHYLDDIELRPLTVLVGANSAGKSSLLQSLLLLKQTLEADRFRGVLKFDGDLTKLGNYANVVSDFDTHRKIEYRFGLQQRTVETDIMLRFATHNDGGVTKVDTFSIKQTTPAYNSNDQSGISLSTDNSGHLKIENIQVPVLFGRNPVPSSVTFDKFWPVSIICSERTANVQAGTQEVKQSIVAMDLIPKVGELLRYLENWLTIQLEYLGPLRADPRPFYPIEETVDVGTRGEDTIPYLLYHQHDVVDYIPSPMHSGKHGTLLDALNYWLRAMSITDWLSINLLENIAYTASVQSRSASSRSVNLSQVGFGVGQVLPVLVSGLKEPNDTTLLLEQPEIHLHPRLQAMLAEFLLCTAQGGKTVIVETHSDHLINRLRRCIAEDGTGTLANMVNILFVHPGTEDEPGSYVEELKIDENGNIVNWPPDFLSETANESLAILHAAQQKAAAVGT